MILPWCFVLVCVDVIRVLGVVSLAHRIVRVVFPPSCRAGISLCAEPGGIFSVHVEEKHRLFAVCVRSMARAVCDEGSMKVGGKEIEWQNTHMQAREYIA
jgi:hypothetical protein